MRRFSWIFIIGIGMTFSSRAQEPSKITDPFVSEDDEMSVKAEPAATPTPEATTTPEPTPIPTATPTPEPSPTPTVSPTPKVTVSGYSDAHPFKEVSLSILPGYSNASDPPAALSDEAFFMGAHVSVFSHRFFGVHVPYTYSRFSHANVHSLGGGPIFRLLDLEYVRASLDANALYYRVLGGNHFGWSGGADITFGWKNVMLMPFVGPFVRYEAAYLSGPNLKSLTFGLGLTLTNLTDLD